MSIRVWRKDEGRRVEIDLALIYTYIYYTPPSVILDRGNRDRWKYTHTYADFRVAAHS